METKRKRRNGTISKGLCFLLCMLLLAGRSSSPARAEKTQDASGWADLQARIDRAQSGEKLLLTGNVTAGGEDRALVIPDGLDLTIDLMGCAIDRGLENAAGPVDPVIRISPYAILTVRDSSPDAAGLITGGWAMDGGGISNMGTLILEGGCIAGNRAEDTGGGIANDGILILRGGSVTDNTAANRGGGIRNGPLGQLAISGASVFDNHAPADREISNDGTMKTRGERTEEIQAIRSFIYRLSVFPTLALLAALSYTVHLDNYLFRKQKRIIYIIILLVFILFLQNILDYSMNAFPERVMLRTAVAFCGYAVRPAIVAMFFYIIQPDRKYRAAWILVGLNAALYLTAFFTPLTFSFAEGYFASGPLHQVCLIVSVLLFTYLFYLTARDFQLSGSREAWLPCLVILFITVAVLLDYNIVFTAQPVSFLTIAAVICCTLYYNWLHLLFVRKHEQALRAEQRIQIMRTQIQPHFLYNTIATFKALCRKDPGKAAEVADKFGSYLRQNLDSLDVQGKIPFRKELEHTRLYADIEMVRFDNVRVEYDIADSDFTVPPLTLQPIVENAIRHGVRIREKGIVRVRTQRTASGHEILIRDNGTGFDPGEAETREGQHLGIRNVRERIERMCGGSLIIESTKGTGTVVKITIPDGEETV